jgi:hypothetical protein
MLSHFSELSHFSCYTAQSFFIELQCSAIFHYYNAHPFANGYSEHIHFCYSAQLFYGFVNHSRDPVNYFATMLDHFMILSAIFKIMSVILLQCSVISQNCLVGDACGR